MSNPPPPARKSFAQVAAAANALKPKPPVQNKQSSKIASEEAGKGDRLNAPASTARNVRPVAEIPKGNSTSGGHVQHNIGPTEQVSALLQSTHLHDGSTQPSTTELGSKKDNSNSDTKSVTSRTTFTLDEKESLRPDDSASMQAAPEEDRPSPPGSIMAHSGPELDSDTRAFQDQLQEIDRTGQGKILVQRPAHTRDSTADTQNVHNIFPTQLAQSHPVPVQQPSRDAHISTQNIWYTPPDEKLIEALASPKDRLFVLKIEQDIIDFIRDSEEDHLQLPQTNSFYRMLSHKLADYYLLGHVIDDSMTSVRILRTPNCRLPPPLIGPGPASDGATPPPTAPARTIMKRDPNVSKTTSQSNGSEKTFDSVNSSKATSDIGGFDVDDKKESPSKTIDKSSLTREEREHRYNEARARIFKDFDATQQNSLEEKNFQTDKEISRTSSTSGVKKSKKGKKPKDDGFEARSAFDQYGQRLSQDSYQQSPMDQNIQYEGMMAPNMHGQFSSMVPPFHPNPNVSNADFSGFNQMPMNYWTDQAYGNPFPSNHNYGNQEAFGQDHFDVNNVDYDQNHYASQNMASQATPKGSAAPLAGYGHGYPTQNEGGWNQGNYMDMYNSQAFSYSDVSGPYQGFLASDMMPVTSAPGQHGFFQHQHPYFGQQPQYNGFGPHFNPQSQVFVPSVQSASQIYQPTSASNFLSSSQMTGFDTPHSEQMQQQPSTTSSSFGMNFGSRMNGQYRQQLSNTPLMNKSQPHNTPSPSFQQLGPNSTPRSQNHYSTPQNNSITKWSTPASLPPKPPPPAIISPHIQLPDHQQPLPTKPTSSAMTQNTGVSGRA